MASRAANRYGTFTWAAALGLAGILGLTSASSARAQSNESEFRDALQGTWRVQITIVDCATGSPFPGPPIVELLAFARGGTVSGTGSESLPFFQPGQLSSAYGIWNRTGEHRFRSVRDTFILFTTLPNPPFPGFTAGRRRDTESIQVDDDRYTFVTVAQFLDGDGNMLRTGCARSVGQRFK